MNEETDKKLEIVAYIVILIFFLFACLFIYEMVDFYNDYRCSTMPLSDFFQDKSCRKYWGLRDD